MFKFEELSDFDSHIINSIPNYTGLLELIQAVAKDYIEKGSIVYDIGCSSGSLLNTFKDYGAELYGVDVVDIRKYKNFKFIRDTGTSALSATNKINVIFAIFVAQFMGLDKNMFFVNLIKHINNGAVCFFAEKIILNDNKLNASIQKSLLIHKRKSFTDTEILNKEEDLSGIMHPLTSSQLNNALLKHVSYTEIWQSYNFKCYFLQAK